ncbi:MAG: hypothetical protein ACPGU4_07770 [Flavobacteriales bacterium]
MVPSLVFAQAPGKFNYQGVARDASGNLLANQNIGLRFTILSGSPTGTNELIETHSTTTNDFGLFNVIIGEGTNVFVNAAFSIATSSHFLKVEMDASGGTNYLTMGTSQLLSVPYAIHAETAESVLNNPGFEHYVGEAFEGGVVYHVYRDALGEEHGLIVAPNDAGSAAWGVEGIDVPNCESLWNGAGNTASILSNGGSATDAAGICNSYSNDGFEDWYLPSSSELSLLSANVFDVNKTLSTLGGATEIAGILVTDGYWSSTEVLDSHAMIVSFQENSQAPASKSAVVDVRAIRGF